MIKHKQEWIIIIVLFNIFSVFLNLHFLLISSSFCIKVLFHNFNKELLVQIIILVFTWKNSVSSIKMMCTQFSTTSKLQKINKADDKVNNKVDNKADSKVDDVSKICNVYSEFFWLRLQFNKHKLLQRSLLLDIFTIIWCYLLF